MPYPHLPEPYEGPARITCPNDLNDPKLPHDLTVKNLGLFAEQVMPAPKAEFPHGPAWVEAA